MSTRLMALALIAIFYAVSPLGCALGSPAPDAHLALQGLLTGDNVINEALIKEFQRGYGEGQRVGRSRDTKQYLDSGAAKAKKGKIDRALGQAYQRGFNLGREDKTIGDEKFFKQ